MEEVLVGVDEGKYFISLSPHTVWNKLFLSENTENEMDDSKVIDGRYLSNQFFPSLFNDYTLRYDGYLHAVRVQGFRNNELKFDIYITIIIDTDGPETLYTVNIYIDPKEDGAYVNEVLTSQFNQKSAIRYI